MLAQRWQFVPACADSLRLAYAVVFAACASPHHPCLPFPLVRPRPSPHLQAARAVATSSCRLMPAA
jgi:hypothetical protein